MSLVFLLSRPLSKMIMVQSLCVSLVGKTYTHLTESPTSVQTEQIHIVLQLPRPNEENDFRMLSFVSNYHHFLSLIPKSRVLNKVSSGTLQTT